MKRLFCMVLSLVLIIGMLPAISASAATIYWPVPGHTHRSGTYSSGHPAIDISDGSIEGAAIVAAMSGTVQRVFTCTNNHYPNEADCYGFGTGVVIMGDDGRCYQYAHMYPGSIPAGIAVGNYVAAGTMIGRVGNTGNSHGAHLHFGIAVGSNYWENLVNPDLETYIYLNEGDFTPVTKNLSWGDDVCQPNNTDAYIYIKATSNLRGNFTQAGISIWKDGTLVGSKTEDINYSSSYLEIWYNVTSELGITLSPGTDYTYQFFAVFDGQKYTSETKSFTTTCTHNAVTDKAVPSTCAKEGLTEGSHCSICGRVLVAQQTVAKTAHTEVTVPGKDATCTEYGLTDGKCCSACGTVTVAQQKIDKVAHTEVTIPGKSATCGDTGLTDGKKCSVCQTVLQEQTTIAATGKHTYSNNQDTSCNVCGHTRTVKQETVSVYRLYNPYTNEHLLTGGISERDQLIGVGWSLDGVAWKAPVEGIPVYRLYNPYDDWHTYTTSESERDTMVAAGWNVDGTVSRGADPKTGLPIYRLFNPYEQINFHLFTADTAERDMLINAGWVLEGVAWYAVK